MWEDLAKPSAGRRLMWRAECQQCKWTSQDCVNKAAAAAVAELHETENKEHTVKLLNSLR